MKKLLSLLILFLLLPLSGWGGTYYVSPSGDDSDGLTWPTAYKLPESAVATGDGAAGPHTVYIAPGTYASYTYFTNANWEAATIIGVAAHGSTTPATKGQIMIGNALQSGCYVNQPGITIQNIGYTSTASNRDAIYYDSAGFTGTNLYLKDAGRYLFFSAGGSNFTLEKTLGEGAAGVAGVNLAGAIGTSNINYSIFRNSATNPLGTWDGTDGYGVWNASSGILNLNNTDVMGSDSHGINHTGTGITNVVNSPVISGDINADARAVNQTDGTVNVTYSNLIPNWRAPGGFTSGTIATDSHNIKTGKTGFRKRSFPAYIIPCIDDTSNSAEVLDFAAMLKAKGWKGSFFVNTINLSAGYIALINPILADGTFTLASHNSSNARQDVTDTDVVWNVVKAGQTINIDQTANTITVSGQTPIANLKTTQLGDLKTALAALGCTVGTLNAKLDQFTLGESLKDTGGAQSIDGAGYDVLLNLDTTGAGGFYKAEIFDPKATLESTFGVTVPTVGFPQGYSSADAITAATNAGFTAIRNTVYTTGSTTQWRMKNIDLMQLSVLNAGTFVDADNDNLRRNIRAICETMTQTGGMLALANHGTTDISLAQYQIVLDTIAEYPEITVTDLNTAVNTIKTGGLWATADDRVYTRTFTDASDYRLRAGSPAINAGTSTSSGTVTLANSRLSLVAGTAFVDFSSAGTLTPYLGGKLTLTDSAGKKAIGYLKAAGTGETLGDELVTNGTFTSDVTQWSVTAPTTIAWNAGGYADLTRALGSGSASQPLTNPLGAVLKGSVNVIALSHKVGLRASLVNFFADTASMGVISGYISAPVANLGLGVAASSSATATCTVDDVSVKQVLTPSATGVTITSTPGGTTYNWASVEAGFNFNDSAGYSYTITDFLPTTDFSGRVIRGLPDIGAYEFYGSAGGGLGMGMIYGY